MHALHFALAALPLAAYFGLIGLIRLRRRPYVTTGARDTAALAAALIGLVFVGPMALFVPEEATVRFGWVVWPLLLAFYSLTVTLVVLVARPRIVVYNITREQLHPLVSEVAGDLDKNARWAGTSLYLPGHDIGVQVEVNDAIRVATLTAIGRNPSGSGWTTFEWAMAHGLNSQTSRSSLSGVFLLSMASSLVLLTVSWLVMASSDLPVAAARLVNGHL